MSPALRDHALRNILASNALTAAVALLFDWSLLAVLWPFWIQSVVIGVFARRRILKLVEFSTEGLKINERSVEPTPATRTEVANFFALHYGLFHFFYFVFLAGFTATSISGGGVVPVTDGGTGEVTQVVIGVLGPIDLVLFLGLGYAFWRTHAASHREHVAADLGGRPNIGTLMFMPYLRILPMHLSIILGAVLGGSTAVLLFLALKTAADAGMHMIEHALLAKRPRP
jgi:hypothetical protein